MLNAGPCLPPVPPGRTGWQATGLAFSVPQDPLKTGGADDMPPGNPWHCRAVAYFSLSAFTTTTRELSDMPIAAIQGATRPLAASGTAQRL